MLKKTHTRLITLASTRIPPVLSENKGAKPIPILNSNEKSVRVKFFKKIQLFVHSLPSLQRVSLAISGKYDVFDIKSIESAIKRACAKSLEMFGSGKRLYTFVPFRLPKCVIKNEE